MLQPECSRLIVFKQRQQFVVITLKIPNSKLNLLFLHGKQQLPVDISRQKVSELSSDSPTSSLSNAKHLAIFPGNLFRFSASKACLFVLCSAWFCFILRFSPIVAECLNFLSFYYEQAELIYKPQLFIANTMRGAILVAPILCLLKSLFLICFLIVGLCRKYLKVFGLCNIQFSKRTHFLIYMYHHKFSYFKLNF